MGFYLLHLHLHGLFRGHDLELGRDADTGGQTTYVLELARSLAARPEVDRVEVVTRQIHDKRVSPEYAQPREELGDGAVILRLPCGPRRYLRKELLWPHLDELADALVAQLSAQERRPDWIHAHYADAGYVGALVSQRLGIPLVFTGHSLGREKQRRLLEGGMAHDQIEHTYAISRRIEAEERALAQAALVITSTQQEAEQQYSRYDQFVPQQAAVVPPGVDSCRFHPQELPGEEEAITALMQPFLRDPAKPPLLCICRAVRRKNVPALVEAYGRSALLRERHNLVLVLGCRDDPRAMEKQQRDQFQQIFELVDRFDLYGHVADPKQHRSEDIPALYRWAARRCVREPCSHRALRAHPAGGCGQRAAGGGHRRWRSLRHPGQLPERVVGGCVGSRCGSSPGPCPWPAAGWRWRRCTPPAPPPRRPARWRGRSAAGT